MTNRMKIALIGSRGIPAKYGGFETFFEQLAVRLVQRGHGVTVYNRSHFFDSPISEYRGVSIRSLPSIPTKHLDTITHTLLSTINALFFDRYDITYYCVVGNSPLVWMPRIVGSRTLMNVDGQDWAREKWSGFARWYQRKCERIATKTADVIISDAKHIQKRYKSLYGADSVFVPYGANIVRDERRECLDKWGLKPDQYLLYVGRMVPENCIHQLIEAYRGVKTEKKLVIVGDAPFEEEYKTHLRAIADERVIFTGYAFGSDYAQLSTHALFYVQPSGIDGTRPALLDQMGFGNCVLVRNSAVNMEVAAEYGCCFDAADVVQSLRERMQELIDSPDKVRRYREIVAERVKSFYNWEWITDFYEDLFWRLIGRRETLSYDAFLIRRSHAEKASK